VVEWVEMGFLVKKETRKAVELAGIGGVEETGCGNVPATVGEVPGCSANPEEERDGTN
jgi:hypothetical protein